MNTDPEVPDDMPDQRPHGRTKRGATWKQVEAVVSGLISAVQLEQSVQYHGGSAPHWVNLAVLVVRCCTGVAAVAAEVAKRRRSG